MRLKLFLAPIIAILITTGCYLPISGRVIDAETNKPIEGAVVLVEWTKTIGFGLTRTESYKVAEAISDKDGEIRLSGCYSPVVNKPHVTVYKKGYVAWNDESIFPALTQRVDFTWGSYVFRLEKFRPEYSYDKHVSFIWSSIREYQNYDAKKIIINAFEWERGKAFQERERSRM